MAVSAVYAAVALLPLTALAEIGVAESYPALTPAPNGPYRVSGNRILDKQSRHYLIRGTQLAPLTGNLTDGQGSPTEFGHLSATTLITIRQRLNMNAVRLPVSAGEYEAHSEYRSRLERLVRLANRFELLVILEATDSENLEPFWTHVAEQFRNNANIFFAPRSADFIPAIRRFGAPQPIVVSAENSELPKDRDIIYEVSPHYSAIRTESERSRQFGLAATRPLLVNGLDPQLESVSGECPDFPRDPVEATSLVQSNLAYFDAHGISWTLSSFTPGKLITDYRWFIGTKLDGGWSCGKPDGAGLGVVLLAHLWDATPLGLFTVSQSRGGLVIARGAVSATYGPIMADQEMEAKGSVLPTVLGNISIRVTDSRGIARLARLLYTGAGWSSANFLTPDDAKPGPAEVAVVRADGSLSKSKVVIADIAPAIFTSPPDGRSAANGEVTQRTPGKPDKSFPSWKCEQNVCRAIPIPLSDSIATTVRLIGTGFRHIGRTPDMQVIVGGIPAPVLSVGPGTSPGADQITIRLPEALAGVGETDLYFTVNGELSNVVRINCGSGAGPKVLRIPKGFPAPVIPENNPVTVEKVRLGRYLFYDKRMSVNGTTACATCHRQALAFTDGRARAQGATGELHPRGAMTLVNVAWNRSFNWGDPSVHSLEEQALKPMLSTHPVELGFGIIEKSFLEQIRTDPIYGALFQAAFPKDRNPWTTTNITKALASFERTIISSQSGWDRFHFEQEENAISAAAKRGEVLFFLDGGPSCFRCHGGFNFSDSVTSARFHNTGLYNLAGEFSYPPGGLGLYDTSNRIEDVGRFKTPTLRNVALTAPYMHDGSVATLSDAIDHYASGGRTIATGPLAGVGHENPGKDKLVHGFTLTAGAKADLIAFLESLTDQSLLSDPELSDPWPI